MLVDRMGVNVTLQSRSLKDYKALAAFEASVHIDSDEVR